MTEGGDSLRAKAARILRRGQRNTWLEVVLDEGRNRQIRRMLAHFGIEVQRLVRVAIGPLELGKLSKGAFRPLTAEEKLGLDAAMAGSGADLRSPRSPARNRPDGQGESRCPAGHKDQAYFVGDLKVLCMNGARAAKLAARSSCCSCSRVKSGPAEIKSYPLRLI